jgi:hypothetical protein
MVIAPPANARTKATVPREEFGRDRIRRTKQVPEIAAIQIHVQRIRDFFDPPAARPAVEAMDSGRSEMNTAAR